MKKMSRRTANRLVAIAFVLLFALLAATPLVPEAEVGSCLMINALGIDCDENGVTLTAETADGTSTLTVHGEGVRVTDALQDMNERYGRRAELGHCGVIVMGGDMSADDIGFALMSLLSEAAASAGCATVSASGSAEDFIGKAVELTSAAGSGVSSYIGFADTSSSVSVPTALSVLADLKSKSAACALPVFSAAETDVAKGTSNSQNSGSDGGSQSSSGSSGKQSELIPPRRVRAVGKTVFELSRDAAIGQMLFSPRAHGGLTDTEWTYGGETCLIQGEITDKSAGLKVGFRDGGVYVTLSVSATIRFADRFIVIEKGGGENVVEELAASLEDAFARTLERCVLAAAESSRTEDFLGILTELYRTSPHEFTTSRPDLSSAVFETDIEVKVS